MEARYRPQVCTFCGVIPEIDIWRAADLMLKRYSETALEESIPPANELAVAGDQNGAAVWVGLCMLERHSATSSIQMQQRG
jgi:hypothetical protein